MFDSISTGVQHAIDFGTICLNLLEHLAKELPADVQQLPEMAGVVELSNIVETWRQEVAKVAKDAETFIAKRDWVGLPQLDAPKSRALLRDFEAKHPDLLKGVKLK